MSPADLDEIKRLLAEYRGYVARKRQPQTTHARRHLETALVRHADALIAAAEVILLHSPKPSLRLAGVRVLDAGSFSGGEA